jgi:N6-adenosine-specific RNA methylase IME4
MSEKLQKTTQKEEEEEEEEEASPPLSQSKKSPTIQWPDLCQTMEQELASLIDQEIPKKLLEIESRETFAKAIDFIGVEIEIPLKISMEIDQDTYHLPASSVLLQTTFNRLPNWLEDQEYDFMIFDHPWKNKSVKRSRLAQYEMTLDHYSLLQLPIHTTLSKTGFIGMWVTNNPKYHEFILKKLFPCWKVVLVSTLIWIKSKDDGDSLYSNLGRKPYEMLYIAAKVGTRSPFPPEMVYDALPTIHSQKPILDSFFASYLGDFDERRKFEGFARKLRKGWTCWGNQVIIFNKSC